LTIFFFIFFRFSYDKLYSIVVSLIKKQHNV
jgi:hypothetical protein